MAMTNVAWTKPGDTFIDFAQPLTHAIAAAAAAGGVDGIMQYTPYTDADRPKYGSRAEAQIAHEHGLYYMLNWEIEADRALQGYPTGRSDGARNRAALRAMGYPETVSAPVSVDMNTVLGNKDATSGFVRGHWETDGDQAENIAYLDTDGGRVLEAMGLNPHIWIPGALSWSPELYSYWRSLSPGLSMSLRRQILATKAAENPMAVAIQFPSEPAFGIRVDFNTVLRPFRVWSAPHEVGEDPPLPIPHPDPQENDMAFIIIADGRNPAIMDAGYAHGIGGATLANAKLPVMQLEPGEWDEMVATSDHKKAADQARTSASGGTAAPTRFAGTISAVPGAVELNAVG